MLDHINRQRMNRQGFQRLNSRVCIPDARLGVGVAEHLAPMGVRIQYENKVPKLVLPSMSHLPFEKISQTKVEASMFQTDSFSKGAPYSGV
ncbi:hypothetical protein CON65_12610 [Bacillus pseudomycoides]|uniref:Uncharacterized protein n=1 Tax=Bacillus pseudomycoides TaxID=64104 RepID=A0AA91VC76_9BACI|nr:MULTISPECIES: hypothetical protein [Bacillus]PED82319.1 hypothetical protein CON65_12610 [Bacillus pseudomycoides]PFW63029.1 hypothetical protein COL20_10435 [Bacillus sp. AFS075034]